MSRPFFRTLATATALLSATACTLDNFGGPNDTMQFDTAFDSAPAGMDVTSSTFAADSNGAWGGPRRGRGPGGPGMLGLMGGGMGPEFMGSGGIGRGAHRGPFAIRIDSSCTVAAGDVTCTRTHNGLTATTIYTIKDAGGAAQTKLDTITTNSVRTRTTVSGTTTRGRDGASVTATVSNSSDRTVTGLAAASTQRTVNGTSAGSESTTGTNRDGQAFTAARVSFDTTTGLVIPVSTTAQTFPTAGKVIRRMKVTTTVAGSTPSVRERREEVTYDGSATAKVAITVDGSTKNCTMALPRGRPNCG
ncbi:hypothetical protein [Gemmatimonas phototrophica]|uniref:Lipoprotein n=1 Tax=Gemmatimonas phototrophica TaxID=1379270 RepID=A0A143BME2_9BACT|nr:hypothetical protein [Gemmatimonas phototrophica]AMW05672.1 hypothetical protein GEMMAAP_14415 [Gemmatimonas phototrophica]